MASKQEELLVSHLLKSVALLEKLGIGSAEELQTTMNQFSSGKDSLESIGHYLEWYAGSIRDAKKVGNTITIHLHSTE